MKANHSKFTVISAIASTLLLGSSASLSADYPEAGNFSNGSRIWADNCTRCHNLRGPKELRDDQWISTTFHMRVRGGLTGQETRDIITFLQASNTKAVSESSTLVAARAGTGATGKETYNQTCISCHGGDGKGAFPGVPDFTDKDGRLSKSDDVLKKHVIEGYQSPGSAMAMPPKGGNPNLSESDIDRVLSYIRETFGK